MTHNELKNLPKLGEMRRLELLFAQHNNIEELPDIEGCEQIQEMYFGNNYIKVKCHYSSKFFASIIFIFVTLGSYLTQKNIYILFCNIVLQTFPSDFCENLHHLKILDLRDNKIEEIPQNIAMLQSLIRLDLTNNDLNS